MQTKTAKIDKQYELLELKESDLKESPFKQFEKWFDDAVGAEIIHPHAMTLATASKEGKPSARMMLMKGFDERGFVFYSNCESRKGGELSGNPFAAMVFWWAELERQVRIEGHIEQVSDREADSYFDSRPRGSRLGAWTSNQSCVVSGREALERRMEELNEKYSERYIPRPHYWIGYRLRAESIEFWQGRPNRLHDRLRYRLLGNGKWVIERLAP